MQWNELHCTALHYTTLPFADNFKYLYPQDNLQRRGLCKFVQTVTIAPHCIKLHCTAMNYNSLHCISLPCTVLHWNELHCNALHCTPQNISTLHYYTQYQTCINWPQLPAALARGWKRKLCRVQKTAQQCIKMHCPALLCTSLYWMNLVHDFYD